MACWTDLPRVLSFRNSLFELIIDVSGVPGFFQKVLGGYLFDFEEFDCAWFSEHAKTLKASETFFWFKFKHKGSPS